MVPNVIHLSERLHLRVCRTEKFKAGMLSVCTVLPIKKELTYMTSLLLSVLLRGTETYRTVSDINRRLDYLYGTELSVRNFYRGDAHIIGLSTDLIDECYLPRTEGEDLILDGALDVIREILFHPVLDENGLLDAHYVESEKKLQCDTIRAQKNHPHAYAADRLRTLMYENEPCGVSLYGNEEDVMAVTPAQLTQHWRALLKDLSLDCFYVGNAEETLLSASLKASLGAELNSEKPPLPPSPVSASPLSLALEVRHHEEELPVSQGHLVMGFRTGINVCDRDFYACTVFNEILGASPVSKLFMNVRERLGLCYSCHSVYNIYKGALLVSCGLENENREAAEREILHQISRIEKGEISDEEWYAAKKSLENAYRQLEDSPGALESFYFGRALVGHSTTLSDCRRGFDAVTRDDVIAVAKKLRADTFFYLRETGNGEETLYEDD